MDNLEQQNKQRFDELMAVIIGNLTVLFESTPIQEVGYRPKQLLYSVGKLLQSPPNGKAKPALDAADQAAADMTNELASVLDTIENNEQTDGEVEQ